MLKKASSLFTTAYLVILFCLFPFYLEEGYNNIGEAKFHFFKYVSLAAVIILLTISLLLFVNRIRDYYKQKTIYLIDWERISWTDMLVLLYATEIFLSFALSSYKKEALWGTEGWYMGCVTQLLFCLFYFFVSRFWNGSVRPIYGLLAASAVVFLLGICNRFSFYPLYLEGAQPEFISTLGNINWFCGFLSVTAPIGIALFLFAKKGKYLLGAYVLLAFMAAFAQGSTSVFLWFFGLFFFLLWVALEEKSCPQNFPLLLFLWGIAAQLIRLMRVLMPGRFNYGTDDLCGYFTSSSLSLWVSVAAFLLFLLMKSPTFYKHFRTLLLLGTGIVLLGFAVLGFINTIWGIPFLKNFSFLTFDSNWGNGRGAALYAGIKAFGEMPFLQKMFGMGPDCFSVYAYSVPELASYLRQAFGSARLTNAHNELLTALVNTGMVGVLIYVGIFVSLFKSYFRKCCKTATAAEQRVAESSEQSKTETEESSADLRCSQLQTALAAGIFCCLIHNMVSFVQILNLPFVFLFLGMYEKIRREQR